jgi:hypothetical protein
MDELAPYMRGWRGYFGFCETPDVLIVLTRWVRLRLRAALWRQWKTPRRRRAALVALRISGELRNTASSGRGPRPIALSSNRRIRTRTYGGVGGGAERLPLSRSAIQDGPRAGSYEAQCSEPGTFRPNQAIWQFVFKHQIAIAVTVFAHVATLPFLLSSGGLHP